MNKKAYMKPAMQVTELALSAQILNNSVTNVTTSGLGNDNLQKGGSGSSWDSAMGRRSVWDEEEEED